MSNTEMPADFRCQVLIAQFQANHFTDEAVSVVGLHPTSYWNRIGIPEYESWLNWIWDEGLPHAPVDSFVWQKM
jgi:hypothetical protein